MDDLEAAALTTDLLVTAALSHRKKELPTTGRCLNCDEPTGTQRFCDVDCRDDFEKRNRH